MNVAFHPDQKSLAVSMYGGATMIWDLRSLPEGCPHCKPKMAFANPREPNKGFVLRAGFSPDGALFSTADGSSARLWDPKTGELTLTYRDHREAVTTSRRMK